MLSHQHAPLPSSNFIRLVKIGPRNDEKELIQLSLHQTRLRNAPKYEALSYEWGTQMCDKPVLCDGQELRVKANLAAALERLRWADDSRWMWIDAICIDQENIPERNQQVTMMRDIYALADRVLIWIGDELAYSKQAFEALSKFAKLWQAREVTRLQAGDKRPPLRTEPSTAEKSSLALQDDSLWTSLFTLFSSTYFERTWIIQEIAVSTRSTVICGAQQMNWKLFHWGVSFISTTTSLLHRAPDTERIGIIASIAGIQSMFKQKETDYLSDYLRFVQASKCSDPRDKVFGLLGLRCNTEEILPHLAKNMLRVDYTKSVQQVYRDAAAYIILSQQDLEICYAQPLTSKIVQKLPSWVPDWSVRMEGAPAAFLITHYKVRDILPGNISFDGSSMYVDGLILDSIDFATSTMSSETPLPDIKRIIIHLSKLADLANVDCGEPGSAFRYMINYLGCSIYKNKESVLEALWRTLIGNTANFEPAKPRFIRHFQAVLNTILLRERGIVFDRHNSSHELALDPDILQKLKNDKISQNICQSVQEGQSMLFLLELVNTVSGRVFFTTSRGYMGFGASGAKVGDQVCILGGGWTPFVLRDHKTYYEMIGDSYLHGMMQGETLDLGKPKVTRFQIC
ncbi:putative heterokaryon incompatibility protein [Botrytis fragariae]|uniref:Putative heterokaryon incompatibility protein n=1 Tax=Botrytis fragariae TaxID=1964551 RepID=A0A8H6AZD7_9HELO|nr:putative heterokaryon incompatibility protein [Botrytis fragariae]KAF5876593.1 putative heterokaryon incompatibility protein [Botrytis fragariae]